MANVISLSIYKYLIYNQQNFISIITGLFILSNGYDLPWEITRSWHFLRLQLHIGHSSCNFIIYTHPTYLKILTQRTTWCLPPPAFYFLVCSRRSCWAMSWPRARNELASPSQISSYDIEVNVSPTLSGYKSVCMCENKGEIERERRVLNDNCHSSVFIPGAVSSSQISVCQPGRYESIQGWQSSWGNCQTYLSTVFPRGLLKGERAKEGCNYSLLIFHMVPEQTSCFNMGLK